MQQTLELKNPPFSTQIMAWHEDALIAHRRKLTDAIDNVKSQQAKNQNTCPQMLPVWEGGIMLIDDELERRQRESKTIKEAFAAATFSRSEILKNHLKKMGA